MSVISGHYAAYDLSHSFRKEQKSIAGRKLFVDYKVRRVVRIGVRENLLPQFNQLILVTNVKLLDIFLHSWCCCRTIIRLTIRP
jgi:hypothetical protein